MIRKIKEKIKLWRYWRKKYPSYNTWYDLKVLFGIEQPFSFVVMAPLKMFIDHMDKLGKEIDKGNVPQTNSKKI